MIQELQQTFQELEQERDIHGVILASSSPKIFSAGLDLMEMYNPKRENLATFWRSLQDLFATLYLSPLATVAAIEGHAPAGGCFLSICCDYRVMSQGGAVIGLNETKLGIVAPAWFRDVFVNTVGHRVAEHMLSLGAQVDADSAKAIHLVDEAVPSNEVLPHAKKALGEWTSIPAHARGLTKKLMREKTVAQLMKNRDADIQVFQDLIMQPRVQKSLEMYLASLRKK